MNPIIEALREKVEADPLPAADTSSHWRQYGASTIVEYREDGVTLRASGFDLIARPRLPGHVLQLIERLSYRAVTSRLGSFAEIWPVAKQLLRDLGGGPDFSTLKNVCILATLTDHWRAHGLSPKTFAVIGDGYGFLGALIRRVRPGVQLYCIDLPKILVFQAETHGRASRGAAMRLLSSETRVQRDAAEIAFVLPQDIEAIPGPIDCAINIASMQEMTESSIASYFAFLRRRSGPHSQFYCVNRQRKVLPGGEITQFSEYPWRSEDEVFIDGPCPYYTHWFAPYTHPNGPRLLGVRVPYINRFDGEMLHRLVRLAPAP